jgi:hypothetical protein
MPAGSGGLIKGMGLFSRAIRGEAHPVKIIKNNKKNLLMIFFCFGWFYFLFYIEVNKGNFYILDRNNNLFAEVVSRSLGSPCA